MYPSLRLIAAVWALALAGAVPAWPQASVSLGVENHRADAPVEITSEELSLDQASGKAVFTGNVIVGQGDLVLTCDRMEVEYAPDAGTGRNEIEVIRLFGGVTFVGPTEAAEADTAVYTLDEEIIVLTGNVLVTQGPTAISGDRLTYNLATGEGTMSGRVRTVLNPDQ